MGDVTKFVIEPMMALFGPVTSSDTDTVLDVYERTLGGYENETLKAAFDKVCETFVPSRRMAWPAPAMIRSACQLICEQKVGNAPEKRYQFPSKMGPYDPATVAQWERATAWRNSLPDDHPLVRQSTELKRWLDTSKPAFERMQRESRTGLHRARLSERSRRMQGDDL